jgi:hypothetical protein
LKNARLDAGNLRAAVQDELVMKQTGAWQANGAGAD